MSKITHSELVMALAKPPYDIYKSLSPYSIDLWHGATGVSGEAGELLEALCTPFSTIDRVNVVEELGDLEFYIEQIRQRVGFIRDEIPFALQMDSSSVPDQTLLIRYGASVSIHAASVLDIVKKTVIYNKKLDLEKLRAELRMLEGAMGSVRLVLRIEREETIEANITKLMKRYESLSYSDKAAQDRADKAGQEPQRRFFGNMG